MKKALAASLAGAALAASFCVAGTAAADPIDVTPFPVLNGSGSDTTEIVMKALDGQINALGSWDTTATVGAWDTNGALAGCSFEGRVVGSGAGRTALANAVSNGDGCFQFARSSSRSTSAVPAPLAIGAGATTYTGTGTASVALLPITLATDGLTYVLRAGSNTPRDLTIGQLRAIYNCTFTGVVDGRNMAASSIPNQPLLPTDASGSRQDWLVFMNLAANTTASAALDVSSDGGTLPTCIDDGPGDTGAAGGEYVEHQGRVLANSRQIILHSIPQYLSQGTVSLASDDTRGLSLLGSINGKVNLELFDNPAGALTATTPSGSTTIVDGALFRPVYNIIPATEVANPTYTAVFGTRAGGTDNTAGTNGANDIPSGGTICGLDDVIRQAGFKPVC